MTEDPRIEEAGPAAPPEPERPPLSRTESHRVVAGVCGGLGRHLDIDPVVFRVVVAVLCLSGGLGLFLYGLAWLIVPTEQTPDGKGGTRSGRTELQRVLTGRVDGQSIGAVLLTVIGTGVFFSSMGDGDQLFPLLLLGALIFHAVRYDPERRRRGGRLRGRRRDRHGHGHGFGGPHGLHGGPPGGPYDRWFPEQEPAGRPDDWTEEARERHARERAAGAVPADTPHSGPTGYLWDPRHPERNPYGPAGAAVPPPGAPTRPWWQRSDLPEGDPLRKSEAGPPPHPPAPAAVVRHRSFSFLAPLGLVASVGAACTVWSLSAQRPTPALMTTLLATALLGIGLTILAGAKFGRARGLTVPAVLLTGLLTVVGSSPHSVPTGIGERNWTVASAPALQSKYSLGIGEGVLDLRGLDPAGATLTTDVEVGIGELTVLLPPDVTAQLSVRVMVGDASIGEGSVEAGGHVSRDYRLEPLGGKTSKGTFDLTLSVGLGEIKVVQQ